jgi:pantoate--beta-alanine ligase
MLTMHIAADVRKQVGRWRDARMSVALVPTMGNLHTGHVALIRRAAALADRVVVSIFVNPLQFGPTDDYAAYPRTEEADGLRLTVEGVDLLLLPRLEEIYPRGAEQSTYVEVPGLSDILCGAARPGHFRGVATVVAKLLNIVQPDVAVFGEKDYQQLTIIRRMAADLCFPATIAGVPTVREESGLALSSRNRYLTPGERETAPALYRILRETAASLQDGERDLELLEDIGLSKLVDEGFKPDYYAIRTSALSSPDPSAKELIVLAAARLGHARLIDNVAVDL